MRKFIITFSLSAFIFMTQTGVRAQVTIGATIEPARGAMLDLKEQVPDANNVTAKKGGLLLPRVELDSLRGFSLIPDATQEQKKNHTGLLVYNLKTDETKMLEKGIYQWDGEKWKMLKKITKTESVAVKKKIYQANSADETKILSIGIFDFRMIRDKFDYPQFRINSGAGRQNIYCHLNKYWDSNLNTEAKDLSSSGYSFNVISGVPNLNAWYSFVVDNAKTEKSEVWIADVQNNHMYQVQFIIIESSSTTTYVIIAKRY
jgi:hypothetical protein